jgi:hypothetical protein
MKRLLVAFLLTISVSAVPIHSATADIIQLTVAVDHLTGYNRSLFKLWIDADKNGCNTRKEVLIEESLIEIKDGRQKDLLTQLSNDYRALAQALKSGNDYLVAMFALVADVQLPQMKVFCPNGVTG